MMKSLRLSVLSCIAAASIATSSAQSIEVQGIAAVPRTTGLFSGNNPSDGAREEILNLAKRDALQRHAASFSAAKSKLYRDAERSILDNIGSYVLEPVVIDEGVNSETGKYFIVIRATIDTSRLDAALSGDRGQSAGAQPAGRKISLSFLFVARSTSSVRQFNDRITQVTEGGSSRREVQSEGVAGGQATFASASSASSKTVSGGSTLRQADQLTYNVTSPEDMNASMSQVFSDNGFDVYDYRDVSDQCNGTRPEVVYKSFATSDILPREHRAGTFGAARRCGVGAFATGSLDIGMQDTDPVTGLTRVYVSVRLQVNDLSGPLPKLLASVGPVQYSGTGPNSQVASRNALINAAKEAAQEISDQLKSKGIQ